MKTTANKTTVMLKAIDLELKKILEADIKKLITAQYQKNRDAAFLQLKAA